MKLEVEAVAPFASVTVTDTFEVPVSVGVPEMMPVDALRLSPLTSVPVSTYVKAVRPPVAATDSEYELPAVPVNPMEGVEILNDEATVNVAALEVVDIATPFNVLKTVMA